MLQPTMRGMIHDISRLNNSELAHKIASAAAEPTVTANRTDRPPTILRPGQRRRPHSDHDYWSLSFNLAAGLIITLAIIAAEGWIF